MLCPTCCLPGGMSKPPATQAFQTPKWDVGNLRAQLVPSPVPVSCAGTPWMMLGRPDVQTATQRIQVRFGCQNHCAAQVVGVD